MQPIPAITGQRDRSSKSSVKAGISPLYIGKTHILAIVRELEEEGRVRQRGAKCRQAVCPIQCPLVSQTPKFTVTYAVSTRFSQYQQPAGGCH